MAINVYIQNNDLVMPKQLSPYGIGLLAKTHQSIKEAKANTYVSKVGIQNRRYLGNKYKLLNFINKIIDNEVGQYSSFCDIFAGTGVVGNHFNQPGIKIITNDLLYSNYVGLYTWLGSNNLDLEKIRILIKQLNLVETNKDNYASMNFGNVFFTENNAIKIGMIREMIEKLQINSDEKNVLITSLIYAIDKVANTCGHYDAFRKKMDSLSPLELRMPDFKQENNHDNEIYQKDANQLIKEIECDVLYIDPPYNSRQYCDTYHLLENIALWQKPKVYGVARKMKRDHLKSEYCLKSAYLAFKDLIANAKCKHILVSYNNTGNKKNSRSNARISDEQMIEILSQKGQLKIYEENYKAFTTGQSECDGHTERIFYCKVT